MQFVLPGSPAKGEYQGPGWSEWLLGFGCVVLAGTQLRAMTSAPAQQTALSYYLQEPGVKTFHMCAMSIDFVIVAVVALWIFMWKKAEIWAFLLMALSLSGLIVGWAELIRALNPTPGKVYVLEGLPFNPVNNMGLLGASLFLGYFAMKIPLGTMGALSQIGLKLAVWVGLFGVQWILFEQVVSWLT